MKTTPLVCLMMLLGPTMLFSRSLSVMRASFMTMQLNRVLFVMTASSCIVLLLSMPARSV